MPDVGDKVDVEWDRFNRARAGDDKAWRQVVEAYRSRLTALALLITGSAAAAEDVVQETFLRSINARIDHCAGTVHGYLGTIAYRLAVKEAQRVRRHAEFDGRDSREISLDPMEALLSRERDRLAADAIRSLDDGHRDVLVLRSYGGHSYEEIAALLNIPLGTVKSRMFNGVKSCREYLRRKGVID